MGYPWLKSFCRSMLPAGKMIKNAKEFIKSDIIVLKNTLTHTMLVCYMAHLNCPNGKRKMDVTIDLFCSRDAGLLAERHQNVCVLSQE